MLMSPIRTTPRQATYRDLCEILSQRSGRSRRAQRALLEAELARAIERAHELQARCSQLSALTAAQKEKLIAADIELALAQGDARQRVHGIRREVRAAVERVRMFEAACCEGLARTEHAAAVAPPPFVSAPPVV